MAEEFARHGARIILTARDYEELNRARAQLLDQGSVASPDDILVVPADLRKPEEADYLIHRATEAWGQVDVLVNNAGVITVGPVENQTSRNFHDVMETNFFSGLHCTLSVLPQMLARKNGSIVNISSIGGKVAVPHLLPYTASKFAIVGFSQGLNAELRWEGSLCDDGVPGVDAHRLPSQRSVLGRCGAGVPLVQPWRQSARRFDQRAQRGAAHCARSAGARDRDRHYAAGNTGSPPGQCLSGIDGVWNGAGEPPPS